MADTLDSQELPHADRRSWLALGVVCIGALMIVLDTTIVNVALPVIQDDLGFSQSSLTWIVNAYLVSFGSFLLIAGRMGDLFGRKRIFLLGIVVFTASSVVCGLANGQELLIAGRFAQGLGDHRHGLPARG
jgi:MFS family permease